MNGAKADWQTDRIELDGAPLLRAAPVYLLLEQTLWCDHFTQ